MPVPSPSTEIMMWKTLSAFGVTAFSATPVLMAMVEPMTWADVQARWVYTGISVISAMVTLSVFPAINFKELLGRLGAAAICSLVFVEPVARQIRPYMTDITIPDGIPIVAAAPAACFIGIVAWFGWGFIVWAVKSPRRAFRIVYWWKSPTWTTFDAVFADDAETKVHPALPSNETPQQIVDRLLKDKEVKELLLARIHSMMGTAPDTSTNGPAQGQPSSGVTLTPTQSPVNVVVVEGVAMTSEKTTG